MRRSSSLFLPCLVSQGRPAFHRRCNNLWSHVVLQKKFPLQHILVDTLIVHPPHLGHWGLHPNGVGHPLGPCFLIGVWRRDVARYRKHLATTVLLHVDHARLQPVVQHIHAERQRHRHHGGRFDLHITLPVKVRRRHGTSQVRTALANSAKGAGHIVAPRHPR